MDLQEIDLEKLNQATAWLESLVGKKEISPDKRPQLIQAHDSFNREKGIGHGCSRCRLKRLNRKYREILNSL